MKFKILIIVAHPDDETIGMGSTIKKHIDKGDDVVVISIGVDVVVSFVVIFCEFVVMINNIRANVIFECVC